MISWKRFSERSFRPDLEKALAYAAGSEGGRPPIDPVLMFKVLVIQTIKTLSDERTEYLINDRLSFMRFLGPGLSDRAPDVKTIWLFRERLTKAGAIPALFERFAAMLRGAGYIAMSGQILDASLVAAPRQRNTSGEGRRQRPKGGNADIKAGRVPEHWKDKPAKLSHKDRDARWTLKFTKAKSRDDGSMPAMNLAIPAFPQSPRRSRSSSSCSVRTKWRRIVSRMLSRSCADHQLTSNSSLRVLMRRFPECRSIAFEAAITAVQSDQRTFGNGSRTTGVFCYGG